MNPTPCPFETAVTEAARTRAWTSELRTHRDACPDCGSVAALCEEIVALADATAGAAPAPRSPRALWLSAAHARDFRTRTGAAPARLARIAWPAAAFLALLGFTLVRGWAGWERLSLVSSALPSPQVAAAAAVGLGVTAWVMSTAHRARL